MIARRLGLPLGLALLLACPAWGQDPAPTPPAPAPVFPVAIISAPASHPGSVPLVLFGDQSVTSARLSWILIAPKVPFEVADLPDHPGSVLVVRQPTPGTTYKFALVAYGNGNPAFAFDFADVPVGVLPNPPPTPQPAPGPAPAPAPDPTPNPPSPPAPAVTGPLHAVLMFDVDDPSTAQLRVSTIKQQLAALDCKWSTVASVHPIYASFRPYLPASGVPAVLLMETVNGMSKVVATVPTPAKPSDVVDVVRGLRGVK